MKCDVGAYFIVGKRQERGAVGYLGGIVERLSESLFAGALKRIKKPGVQYLKAIKVYKSNHPKGGIAIAPGKRSATRGTGKHKRSAGTTGFK